jgi:hypothetical protein
MCAASLRERLKCRNVVGEKLANNTSIWSLFHREVRLSLTTNSGDLINNYDYTLTDRTDPVGAMVPLQK